MMSFLVAFLACAGTLSAALALYYWHLGDQNILFDIDAVQDLLVQHDPERNEIICRCSLPLTNRGEQQGMVNNVFCQPVYCGKIMKGMEIKSQINVVKDKARENGYWESLIVKKNAHFMTQLEVRIRHNSVDIPTLIRQVPRLTIVIYYQIVGRKGIQWKLAELPLPLKEAQLPAELKQKKVVE
ncbi:MAG TPA: hypothetical protein GXX21_04055 [Syntrophomonadaceae bacterium]|nr:hypothetical protein [Syntrophomonadaceae bacterium]